MEPTIRDVARLAGVSKSTVSRVLNNDPNVSDRAKGAVGDAMRELNYRPNALARGLSTSRTGTIGLIMSDITNPFHAEVARGVEDLAADYESNVILCNTDGRPTKEQAYIDLRLEKRVDGVIFVSAKMGESDVSMLQARHVPLYSPDAPFWTWRPTALWQTAFSAAFRPRTTSLVWATGE